MIGELSQGFVEASQFFHRLPLYYQIGHGFEVRMFSFSVKKKKKKHTKYYNHFLFFLWNGGGGEILIYLFIF